MTLCRSAVSHGIAWARGLSRIAAMLDNRVDCRTTPVNISFPKPASEKKPTRRTCGHASAQL
jgi:hypothetical protein